MTFAAGPTTTGSGRRIVLILGMHRSGTSMLARLLAALGLPLGEALLNRPTRDNRHGYWEQGEIVALHEALLDGWDRSWHGPNGLRPLPEGWLHAPATRAAKARLTAIVDREISAAGGLWGFKDPRTLRFLPLWREIIAERGLEPVPILAARAPAAVAGSLMRRNRMERRFAEALWAVHTIEAISQTGAALAAVVDYDTWFARPEVTAAWLAARLGLPAERAAIRSIEGLIDPSLRHHPGAPGRADPAFEALHAALIARAPQAPAAPSLQAPMAAAACVIDRIATEGAVSSKRRWAP
jgi:hypothetical protein